MKVIELTPQEINVLMGFLDVAVRAEGLNAAQNALALAQKLQNAPDSKSEEYDPDGALPE